MKEEFHIQNAIIDGTTLTIEDHGLLSAWLYLDYGGSHQGFGGYSLHLPESFKHHKIDSGYAGHFIFRSLQIAGVGKWENLKGQTIRVKLTQKGLGGRIIAIGHIVKDDWFCPEEDFKNEDSKELSA